MNGTTRVFARYALLTQFCLVVCALPVFAEGGVVAVRGREAAPYTEALRGFRSVIGSLDADLVISGMPGVDVAGEVRTRAPRLILAVGLDALVAVRDMGDIPVVHVMVPDPGGLIGPRENISGVGLTVSPAEQLEWMKRISPETKRVGVVHDPLKTGYIVSRAREPAGRLGIELVIEEAGSARELPARLRKLKGRVDFLWMLPDTTVYAPEAVEALLLFSLESKIPVFTFSRRYVELGALASLDMDPYAAGRQAGEMARAILAGSPVPRVPARDPENNRLHVNTSVARKLGVTLGDAVLRYSTIIERAGP